MPADKAVGFAAHRQRLGIGSYNRQLEFLKGVNAKHTAPTFRFEPRRLGVIVGYGSPDQRYIELRDELTADTIEPAVQTLRVATGRIAFCRPGGGPSISTTDLARQMGAGRSPSRGKARAEDALQTIVLAMAETPAGDHPPHPRRIYVR